MVTAAMLLVPMASVLATGGRAAAQETGSISGTVTAAGGGTLSGICVAASDPGNPFAPVSTTSSGPDGTYTLTGLAGGDYYVFFSNGCGNPGTYAAQWYDNQPDVIAANTVSVTAGSTTGAINAVMEFPGSIAGTVTAQGGGRLGGICVWAALQPPHPGPPTGHATTATNGTYTMGNLPAGNYDVWFSQGCGNNDNYATQWYDNQPTPATATSVSVTAGQTTGSIDAAMYPGGSIAGTVAAQGGGPVGGVCVYAFAPGTNLVGKAQPTSAALTASDGAYTLPFLSPGNYLVEFDMNGYLCGGNTYYYASQWYDSQPSLSSANLVSVTAGATHGSVDATFVPGGSISGTVTGPGGGPLRGVCVRVFTTGGDLRGNTSTSYDGSYTIAGLLPGDYHVLFVTDGACPAGLPSDYASQWYNDANLVSVSAGQTIGSIDAVMHSAETPSSLLESLTNLTPSTWRGGTQLITNAQHFVTGVYTRYACSQVIAFRHQLFGVQHNIKIVNPDTAKILDATAEEFLRVLNC